MMAAVPSVANIFFSMEYGPILEGFSLAKDWLDVKSRKLSSYVDGQFIPSESKSDGINVLDQKLSHVVFVADASEDEVEHAAKSSRTAFQVWNGLTPYARGRHIYNIARYLQQHATLLVQMEALIRGVQARDPREWDVPGMIRMFYHHAGWAQQIESEFVGWKAKGVVAGITSRTTPLQALSWLVAPALAAGCTIILKPSRHAAPTALLLADLCTKAGLPAGVLNVITGTSDAARLLIEKNHVKKITFIGSTKTGRIVRQEASGNSIPVTLLMSSRTPMIVLESADLDSACESVIDSAWFNQGQVPWAVTDVFVQQSVFQAFTEKLEVLVKKIRVGTAFDKMADVGSPCNKKTVEAVRELVAKKKKEGSKVLSISEENIPTTGEYIIPTVVIGGTDPDSNVLLDDVWPLPVVMLNSFRTAKEAVSLANNSRYSIAAAIWTQDFPLGEEISQQLKVGTVWINCVNKFDAAIPFGASRQSGFGRIGGREGMFEYLSHKSDAKTLNAHKVHSSSKQSSYKEQASSMLPNVDRTYKLYYGGAHKRPDGNSSLVVNDYNNKPFAMVGDGSRKDIRNAVEAAHKAVPGWRNCGAHLRAQILYYFAENLELRSKEFSEDLSRLVGCTEACALEELHKCVQCLFFWAGVCDKNPIAYSQPPPLPESKVNVQVDHEPVGVIGIICPDSPHQLLTPISVLAPAIALGNAVVMVPNQCCPLPALWLCQVADTSDVPAGVINLITGNPGSLGATLANHHDVNALWSTGSLSLNLVQEFETSVYWNMKPIWIWESEYEWDRQHEPYYTDFYCNSTRSKAVWKPIGGMFGN